MTQTQIIALSVLVLWFLIWIFGMLFCSKYFKFKRKTLKFLAYGAFVWPFIFPILRGEQTIYITR